MTNGLGMGDAYAATLSRIMEQDGDKGRLGIEVLMWISRSERPLRVEELCYALAIEKDSTELDPQNVPAIGTLLNCCLGLVAVDEEGSRVRLIHLTLQEYLNGHSHHFDSAHSKMAEVCLTYLSFQSIKDLPPTLLVSPPQAPFLEYASYYWGVHARKELTERTKSLALQLLDRYDHHASAKLLLRKQWGWPCQTHYQNARSTSGFTGLHAVAYFGVEEVVMALLRSSDWEVNGKDFIGFTPLLWAVRNGHEGVCKLLLELGDVDPKITDNEGRTPPSVASENGHMGIVKLLFECKEANPDSPSGDGKTPLSLAAGNGHKDIVKLLLQCKEVNPDSSDKYGQTPLWKAAGSGHGDIVKLLLQHKEVNPTLSNNDGQTPLFGAAWNGHDGIVKLLL